MIIKDLLLCLVTHPEGRSFQAYKPLLQQAIEGGITSVQYRDKHASSSARYHFASQLQDYLATHHIPLIINDDIALAKTLRADGVHLGQSDAAIQHAREQLDPHVWIGLSIETHEQLIAANQLHTIQYVAASAVFPTQSKTDCKTYWGLTGLKQVVSESKHPVVAIGGINEYNARRVMEQHVTGIAVIGAIHQAHCPKTTALALRTITNKEFL